MQEHQALDVIRAADWVIDLGPEGGAGGGSIISQGHPAEITAQSLVSHTGAALKRAFSESFSSRNDP
jgi:excinuclease ABC subunit A